MIDLNIIHNCAVMRDTISSCRKNLDVDSTPFLVLGGGRYGTDDFDNVETVPQTFKGVIYLFKRMRKADRVHVYGLFYFPLIMILAFFRSIGNKTVWYIYGDDLYCLLRPKKTLKNRLHLCLRKRAYRNIRYVATTVHGDYLLLKQIMGRDYSFFLLRYGPGSIRTIEPYLPNLHSNDRIRILVGNSATRTNHHVEVFEKLNRIINEEYEVFAPLSYGEPGYAEEVIKAGKKMFGPAFHPMTGLLPQAEYFSFLTSIDIAIFACDRQQAMGNIMALLYAGKKVYIRNDTSMWEFFHDEYGVTVFDYDTLDKISEAELRNRDFDVQEQKQKMEDMTDEGKQADSMRRPFISAQNS